MTQDQLFIQRCFDLANLAAGKVSPNPRVGAVITYKNKIIGEGYHQFIGGPHAEVNAVNSLKDKGLLPYSKLYISLEPCHNFGRTPPCVDLILKYKIPEVFISVIDPNPLTIGKSVAKLKAAGVTVKINVLPSKGKKLAAGFFSSLQQNRPYIILKFAQSSNKKIGIVNEQYWISNAYTKSLTHKWRSESNAILVGSRTLLVDNPRLDNRLYFGFSPVKLLLKRDGKMDEDMAALHSKGRSIIICEPTVEKINYTNTKQWFLPFDETLLTNILLNLKKEELNYLLVEGGAATINTFIQQDLWDEARIFTGSQIIDHPNSIPAPIVDGSLKETHQIGDNILQVFENKKSLI